MDCFPFGKLIDFAEGTIEPLERQALLEHITSGCRRCRDEIERLKEMFALMRADKSRKAPHDTIDAAMSLFNKVKRSTLIDTIRKKVTAILAFDSLQQPALAGIRNVKGLGRQFLFKTEGYDIDLRFSPVERSEFESLIGQVLQRDAAAGVSNIVVSLSTQGEEVLLTTTDTFGMFSFRNLPPKREYDVKLVLPDLEITIGGVSPS
jgi:hypothetical protein